MCRPGISCTASLRDSEDRKALIGGMTARPLEVAAVSIVVGGLYDIGGRDFLSSGLVGPTILGNSSTRCPCAASLTALSVRRRLTTGMAVGVVCDCAADVSPVVVLGGSGNDAGRFEPVDGLLDAVSAVGIWNLKERVLEAPPLCFESDEASLSGRVGVLLEWWRAICADSGMRRVGSRGSTATVCDRTGASGVGCCSEGSEMRSFLKSTNRNAGSLEEL